MSRATAMVPVRRCSGVRRRHGCSARAAACVGGVCSLAPEYGTQQVEPGTAQKVGWVCTFFCLAAAGNAGFQAMSAISRLLQGASVVVYTINHSGARSSLQTLLSELAGHQIRPFKL